MALPDNRMGRLPLAGQTGRLRHHNRLALSWTRMADHFRRLALPAPFENLKLTWTGKCPACIAHLEGCGLIKASFWNHFFKGISCFEARNSIVRDAVSSLFGEADLCA